MRKCLALVVLAAVPLFAACGGDDNPPTARTGETTREGEHCTADLPDGTCLTEEEGQRGADRWTAYVDCVQANDGDPKDICPTPGEQADESTDQPSETATTAPPTTITQQSPDELSSTQTDVPSDQLDSYDGDGIGCDALYQDALNAPEGPEGDDEWAALADAECIVGE